MEGLIFDIRRFSVHDGPGIRTTVFMKGCPLTCQWCHNPESRLSEPEVTVKRRVLEGRNISKPETTGYWIKPSDLIHEITRDRIYFEESGGGVTFSGGEPLFQPDFLTAVLEMCKQKGIETAVDTSGYADLELFHRIAPLTDLFLYDLKILDHEDHLHLTGVSNECIKQNLKYLIHSGKNVLLRFPVVPGISNTRKNIEELKAFILNELLYKGKTGHISLKDHRIFSEGTVIKPIRISLLPYHSMAREKYHRFHMTNPLKGLPDLQARDMDSLKQELESMGLSVTIGG